MFQSSLGGNIVIEPKHVADNLNKIVHNYWNRVVLDGNPWTWSNTRNRMQTPKFKIVEYSWSIWTSYKEGTEWEINQDEPERGVCVGAVQSE
jgi:hypothetical protein